jgi:hypothetical protein
LPEYQNLLKVEKKKKKKKDGENTATFNGNNIDDSS